MRAVVQDRYGPPDVLRVEDVERAVPRRVLNPKATLVIVGAPRGNRLVGPLGHIVKVKLAAFPSSQKVVFFIAKFNRAAMAVLGDLLAARTVVPVIDRRYELAATADAFRYLGDGHARGKIVLAI